MRRRLVFAVAAIIMLFPSIATAQQNPLPESLQGDESPYRGHLIADPEALSGLWEAPDGQGGVVGLHLTLMTTIPSTARTLVGVSQSWLHLEVAVYVRGGSTAQLGPQNGFSDSPRGGNVRFDNGRLQLHFASGFHGVPFIDLDLVHKGDTWVGRYHRGAFDKLVTLRRPGANSTSRLKPITGAWLEDGGFHESCLHIPQSNVTELIGWTDSIQLLGSMRYANNIHRPATSLEVYGNLTKVKLSDAAAVSFEFGAFGGICCPHIFTGTRTRDGNKIDGIWPAGPNQSPHEGFWKKIPGGSCFAQPLTCRTEPRRPAVLLLPMRYSGFSCKAE